MSDLAAELKQSMEYNEESVTCSNCDTNEEPDMGVINCVLNPAHHFRVSPQGHCKHWTESSKKG